MNNKTPFNSPRSPELAPYHLRNGSHERAEIDRYEDEHRRRLGMVVPARQCGKTLARFEAWIDSKYPSCDAHVKQLMWEAWQAATGEALSRTEIDTKCRNASDSAKNSTTSLQK